MKNSIKLSWKIFFAISFFYSFLTDGKSYSLSSYLHWSFNTLRTSEFSSVSKQKKVRGEGGRGREGEEEGGGERKGEGEKEGGGERGRGRGREGREGEAGRD